jgi:hypothetical protein
MPRKIDTRQREYTGIHQGLGGTRVHRAENIACTNMYAYTQVLYIHVHMLDKKIKWLVLFVYNRKVNYISRKVNGDQLPTPWSWFDIPSLSSRLIWTFDCDLGAASFSVHVACNPMRLKIHDVQNTLSSLNRILVKNVYGPVAHLLLRKWNTGGEACASGFIGTLNPSIPDCFRERNCARIPRSLIWDREREKSNLENVRVNLHFPVSRVHFISSDMIPWLVEQARSRAGFPPFSDLPFRHKTPFGLLISAIWHFAQQPLHPFWSVSSSL